MRLGRISYFPPTTPNGLPDDAFFPASTFHPDVQLSWANDDDGLNVFRAAGVTASLRVGVPLGNYAEVHVYATAGDGNASVTVTPTYASGMGAPTLFTVPFRVQEIHPINPVSTSCGVAEVNFTSLIWFIPVGGSRPNGTAHAYWTAGCNFPDAAMPRRIGIPILDQNALQSP